MRLDRRSAAAAAAVIGGGGAVAWYQFRPAEPRAPPRPRRPRSAAPRLSAEWWQDRWLFKETPWRCGEDAAANLDWAAACKADQKKRTRRWWGGGDADARGAAGGPRALVPLCGDSPAVVELAARGYAVTAVDWSPEALHQLRVALRQLPAEAAQRVEVVQGDFLDKGTLSPDQRFSLVYDRCGLASTDPARWGEYSERLRGTLAPGGVLFVEAVLRNPRYKGVQGKLPPSADPRSGSPSRPLERFVGRRVQQQGGAALMSQNYRPDCPGVAAPAEHDALHRALYASKGHGGDAADFFAQQDEAGQRAILELAGVPLDQFDHPRMEVGGRRFAVLTNAFVALEPEKRRAAVDSWHLGRLAAGADVPAPHLACGPPFHSPPEVLRAMLAGLEVYCDDEAAAAGVAAASSRQPWVTYRAAGIQS
eukprot:TRINITY_DN37354_c0_g1_i1.p1 TRINITY_DN37354_c0_g1~~TRINITY_DN37354_c0_g1_i1.p1  ORF type:complete len:422 (+),score=79.24 TRINITY_DN37354_c0_g1_i1:73-1338(+)